MNKLGIFNLIFCLLLCIALLYNSEAIARVTKAIHEDREYIIENRELIFANTERIYKYLEELGKAITLPIRLKN